MATVAGYVTAVHFDPNRHWFTAIMVAEPDSCSDVRYQIDGGSFTADGRAVTRAELLAWLVWADERPRTVRVVLTGDFGAAPACESAEFFSE
jgi:hypothetical protein